MTGGVPPVELQKSQSPPPVPPADTEIKISENLNRHQIPLMAALAEL
jgi:hypothetical protein